MIDQLPAILLAAATLAGGLLVFSGFRLYRVALASVGAAVGLILGWIVGSSLGSVELAVGAALAGGLGGALLAGPLEAGFRFLAGGLAAAALPGIVLGGPEQGMAVASGAAAVAFFAGGLAALLLYRTLVVSALAVCGGLLVAGAGAVAADPTLLAPDLIETGSRVAEVFRGDLPAALALVTGSVLAALALQAGDGPDEAGSRRGVRGGGLLLTAGVAAGLALTLEPPADLPGPALAVTGLGPLSWPVAILLLRPVVGLARRGTLPSTGIGGWAVAAALGIAVGLSDAFLSDLFRPASLPDTRFLGSFFGGSPELRLVKASWSLAAFPVLFSWMALSPAGGADSKQDE